MVWVDGRRPVDAKFIPGPASTVPPLVRDYVAFIHRDDVDITTKLALAHYQILMIHPFFDGNGRLSRILALLHAQPVLGAARAFAIAAVLALHRRALRTLFDELRNGNPENYLTYWRNLISWSADCISRIAEFRKRAAERMSSSFAMFQSPERLVSFLLDNPLFSQSDLTKLLRSSGKLGARYIDTLRMKGIIEIQPKSYVAGYFCCPLALEYWRQAMENTASTAAALLPP